MMPCQLQHPRKIGEIMKIIKWLDEHFEEVLMVVLLVGIAILMLVQVFMRRVMGQTLSWSEEVTRYLFVWSVFLSISLTLIKKSAMKLDLFLILLPKKARNPLILISMAVMLVFFIYMSGVSFELLRQTRQVSATLNISMRWIYASTAVGFVLSAIRLLQLMFNKIRTFSVVEEIAEPKEEDYVS